MMDDKYKKIIIYTLIAVLVLVFGFFGYKLFIEVDPTQSVEENNPVQNENKNKSATEKELIGSGIFFDPRFRALVETQILKEYIDYQTIPNNANPFLDQNKVRAEQIKLQLEAEKERAGRESAVTR